MQKQKLKHRKWLSRGPRASIIQSTNMLDLVGDAHLYQITRSQSVWFHAQRTTQTLQATLSGNETFLDQSGNSLALTSGTQVDSERTFQRYSVYWYESLREEGPINRASLFYQLEFSPAASELSNNTATLYDGDFRGFGFSLGRIKDDRGLNFQWRMYFAQLETDFSNNATAHRSLNSAESQVYQLAGKLQWHYRYRLAPYWYVVPYVKIDFSAMLQGKSEPDNVEHDVLTYSSMSSWISLQKKF